MSCIRKVPSLSKHEAIEFNTTMRNYCTRSWVSYVWSWSFVQCVSCPGQSSIECYEVVLAIPMVVQERCHLRQNMKQLDWKPSERKWMSAPSLVHERACSELKHCWIKRFLLYPKLSRSRDSEKVNPLRSLASANRWGEKFQRISALGGNFPKMSVAPSAKCSEGGGGQSWLGKNPIKSPTECYSHSPESQHTWPHGNASHKNR